MPPIQPQNQQAQPFRVMRGARGPMRSPMTSQPSNMAGQNPFGGIVNGAQALGNTAKTMFGSPAGFKSTMQGAGAELKYLGGKAKNLLAQKKQMAGRMPRRNR